MTSKKELDEALDLNTPIFGLPLDKQEMLNRLVEMPDAEEEDNGFNPFILRHLEANRFIFSVMLVESYIKPQEQVIDEITPNIVRLSSRIKQSILTDVKTQQTKLQELLVTTLAPLLLSVDSAMRNSSEILSQSLNDPIEHNELQSAKLQEIVKQASILKFIEHVGKTLKLDPPSKRLLAATYINNITKSNSGNNDLKSILSYLKDVYSKEKIKEVGESSGKKRGLS